VKVRAEDRPVLSSDPSDSSVASSSAPQFEPKTDSAGTRALSELPTEIYVPLVHFAKEEVLVGSAAGYVQSEVDAESPRDEVVDGSESPKNENNANNAASLSSSASSATLSRSLPASSLLDIDVWVSGGRWEIDGQKVRWWYPVPSEGMPDQTYTILIKRTRGPIKLLSDNTSSTCSGFLGFCETLCPMDSGGCCVM